MVENSTRVQINAVGDAGTNLEAVAVVTPTNQRVLVINNRDTNNNYAITIEDLSMTGEHMTVNVEARSFTTFVWNAPN